MFLFIGLLVLGSTILFIGVYYLIMQDGDPRIHLLFDQSPMNPEDTRHTLIAFMFIGVFLLLCASFVWSHI